MEQQHERDGTKWCYAIKTYARCKHQQLLDGLL